MPYFSSVSLLVSMFAFLCSCLNDPSKYAYAFEFVIVEMESCYKTEYEYPKSTFIIDGKEVEIHAQTEQYKYYVKVTAMNGKPTEHYRVWYSNEHVTACSAGKLDPERQTYVYYSNASEVTDLSICNLGDTRAKNYPHSKLSTTDS